ncbi:MAG: hypothetical protein [Circular genetic element sp.]|nr:MAG: hypothetical protein [Circular genetic element sp.]
MAVPIIRAYTTAVPAALNVRTVVTDVITGLQTQQLNRSNTIIDFTNNPDNAAGITHFEQLFINNLDTGVSMFSSNSSPTTAGRTLIGPIPISVGAAAGGKQISYFATQTAGALTAYPTLVKYANLF